VNLLNEKKITFDDQELFLNILTEHTISFGDRLFLRELESPEEQFIRD